MVDPEKFGRAMGEQIKLAIAPLQKDIIALRDENLALKKQLSELPDIQAIIEERMSAAVAAIPAPTNGKDCDMDAVMLAVKELVAAIPAPQDGKDGRDGKDGEKGIDGKDGEKGADGTGMAGAILDRDGCLQITLTNGEVKNLGVVVGKDGKDGLSLESFTMELLEETHEICVKASCAGRTQELRYPAGGIRAAGYWREGTKAKAGEAWVHDGSTWYAKTDTQAKPATSSEDWLLGARKGRDVDPNLPPPAGTIKVGPNKK